jgi:hypothetical protein
VRFGKVIKLRERLSAMLIWEIFNLFNSDNFYNYAGSMQSSAFGTPNSELPKCAQRGGFRLDSNLKGIAIIAYVTGVRRNGCSLPVHRRGASAGQQN